MVWGHACLLTQPRPPPADPASGGPPLGAPLKASRPPKQLYTRQGVLGLWVTKALASQGVWEAERTLGDRGGAWKKAPLTHVFAGVRTSRPQAFQGLRPLGLGVSLKVVARPSKF